jgi:hypothetical protein
VDGGRLDWSGVLVYGVDLACEPGHYDRSLSDTFSGIRPGDMPAFILAQFVGALTALAAARALFPVKKAKAPPTKVKVSIEHAATAKAEALNV